MSNLVNRSAGPDLQVDTAGEPGLVPDTVADGQRRSTHHRRRTLGLLAVAALGAAMVLIQPNSGPSQASHFALVRSLAAGTAEIGPRESIDTSFIGGKYYANKAPGLAFATLPAYLALREVGFQDAPLGSTDGYVGRLWQITLVGAVLPAIVLALLMLVAVERVAPRYGALTAILVSAGTLLLPFSTLLFGHMLSATLGFAAFAVLFLGRGHEPSTWRAGFAGLLAGLAIVVEYPLGIVMLLLAAYLVADARVIPRLMAYAGGCFVGLLPLAAYNQWAFGSPTTLSYANVITTPAGDGPPTLGSGNSTGFYGVAIPDLRVAASLLVSEKGLFVVAPLCLIAALGLPALWRAGYRAEAAVCAAVPTLFLAYNASYYIPFGGQGPGPRFLVPAIPFLALPLGMALSRRFLPVLVLGLASVLVMAVATATNPLTGEEHSIGDWLGKLSRGELISSPFPSDGDYGLLPAAMLLTIAIVLAIVSAGPSRAALRGMIPLAALVLVAWMVTAIAAPHLLPADAGHGTTTGTLAVIVLAITVTASVFLVDRRGVVAAVALIPLLLLVIPEVYTRQRVSLLVTLAALAAVGFAAVGTRSTHRETTGSP